jgi:hypothetical protein
MSEIEPEKTDAMLNPQIFNVTIGKRNMRKITLYPLSLGDEIKVSNIFSEVISIFLVATEMQEERQINSIALLTSMFKIIKDNLGTILTLITDEDGEQLVNEITNVQAEDMIKKIIETNFVSVSKNFKSLLEKSKSLFQSGGQS